MSDYPTLRVVDENVGAFGSGSPFPPLPAAAPAGEPRRVPVTVDGEWLKRADPEELAGELVRLLAATQRRTIDSVLADPAGVDGSVVLDSMTAVFLVATIGKAVGQPRIVNLARVDRNSLSTVRGLASLLHSAIRSLPTARGAA